MKQRSIINADEEYSVSIYRLVKTLLTLTVLKSIWQNYILGVSGTWYDINGTKWTITKTNKTTIKETQVNCNNLPVEMKIVFY